MNNETSLENLIEIVLSELKKRGYSQLTIATHQDVYGRLKRYCIANSSDKYSAAIGERFIQFVKASNCTLSRRSIRHYERSIRRLDCLLSGEEWRPKYRQCCEYAKSCYDDIVNKFEDYLCRVGKTTKLVRRITRMTATFLAKIEQSGCSNLKSITADMIITGFEEATDKSGFRYKIGQFFQYAYNREITTRNLMHLIPMAPVHHGIPSVYSPEEVERLLAAVDRSTVTGLRDYAIILIAARLGLRASDIANLRFENLKADKIEIVQFKTKQPLTTILTDEVKAAIRGYIDNGRPQSTDDHIFLDGGGYKAIEPNNIYRLTRCAFDRSGIDNGSRKRGTHSLRASLATALLAEGSDYPTVQKILGQASIESTKFYAKADIEQLRNYAIHVPLPSGNFAEHLSGKR